MPQLDTSTFLPQVVWLAISFAVLYLLMAKLALPRVGGILEARRHRIDGDLGKAAEMKAQAEAVIAAYERALAEARVEAQATVRETVAKLNEASAERQRALAQSLAAETATAERRIAEAKTAALANLREVAVEVARAAAEKIANTALDAGRAGAAVDAVLRERA